MKTRERLTEAYEEADVIEFDDDARFVFVSDSHRGDGSKADEFARNKAVFVTALRHYDDERFTLIENGDNDDLWEFNPRHILKANKATFDLLRTFHLDGRYLRLFGNHDIQMRKPGYVSQHFDRRVNPVTRAWEPLLPGLQVHAALVLRHRDTGQELFVVHGHQGDLPNDQNWWMTMWSYRLFWKRLHALGFRSPSSPIANSFKRHKVERNYVKWIRNHRVALICGHTHRERFPLGNDLPYFNSGACIFPDSMTALEIEKGAISLVTWRVEADVNGYLHVIRRVLLGPEPLATFDIRHVPDSQLADSSIGRRIADVDEATDDAPAPAQP